MKCSKCGFENPDGLKFCGECGSRLERTCPACNASNPPQFKFCGECGQSLVEPQEPSAPKDLSFDEKLAKIQKYLPSGLTEKVLSQRNRIEGEHRHVTIMFVDMKGFTPLTEKLGPEETFTLMDQVFEVLIQKILDYEGTVNELRGDGVLALFGAPIALEDAPQRAIRSALAMHLDVTKLSETITKDKQIPPILLRIGINSGPVIVGTIGNDLRVQFTAVGDTINMAARMEQMAEPGTTYVTEDTFKLTEGFFRFEALGEKQVKGKQKPMKVYQVIAPSSRRTRFDVSAERGLSQFIGRERDLQLILDSFDRAKACRGQAVSIVGEAGVGKSRLLYEFRKAVTNQDILFLEGKCLSYGRDAAYHPLIDILKSNFGIEDGDADADITAKVKEGLTFLGIDETSTLPYVLELLSVKDSGLDKIPMSPDAKKDGICRALQRIILKGSEHMPLVFAFEDLHWMDKSSGEAIKYLLDSIPAARVLIIFTYRPEFAPRWASKSYHSQLTLNRLARSESLAIVAGLLGSDSIAPELLDLILEKTEGIAFFIEEFVRSLRDMGVIEQTNYAYDLAKDVDRFAIPSTIQDVIMARIDALPEASKEVLQAGSVIEREFSYELIKSVTNFPEQELLSHLSVLKDAELLYERGIFPQSAYVFRHALTREVIYDSILAKRRKALHEKIGNAIEETYAGHLGDHYGVLVQHFHETERYEKAAKYARLAAKKAEKTASLSDAAMYIEKRIACLERLPAKDEIGKEIIDARTVLGVYHIQINNYRKAKEAIDPIIESAAQAGNDRRLSQIYTIIGTFESWLNQDLPKAVEYLNRALELAEKAGDMLGVVLASYWLAIALFLDSQFQKALFHIEKPINITMAFNNPWGAAVMKANQAMFQVFQGQVRLSNLTSSQALELAEQSGDPHSRHIAHTMRGISCLGRGAFDEAIVNLSEGADLAERISNLVFVLYANFWIGETYLEIESCELANNHFKKSIDFFDQTGCLPSWGNLARIGLEKAHVLTGEKNPDLNRLYKYIQDNKFKICEGWMRRYLGEILLKIEGEHIPEAQHWIEEALAADERNQMMLHLGRDYVAYAEVMKRRSDNQKAKEQLAKAIDIYAECGADERVKKAQEDLAKFS